MDYIQGQFGSLYKIEFDRIEINTKDGKVFYIPVKDFTDILSEFVLMYKDTGKLKEVLDRIK